MNLQPLLDTLGIQEDAARARDDGLRTQIPALQARLREAGPCRQYLRQRGSRQTIAEKADSQAARPRKGSRGGRPPAFYQDRYKKRNSMHRFTGHLPLGQCLPLNSHFYAAGRRWRRVQIAHEHTLPAERLKRPHQFVSRSAGQLLGAVRATIGCVPFARD
ncbi:hypothetical protein ABZV61_42055 [Streptomyces sp900116325]|uniref:Phage virion morphogenesis protein n=1 Tax=Streptomyces sp. 900116325 TaxID=3154295 RepID=A0ABV2UMP6_9ACTN